MLPTCKYFFSMLLVLSTTGIAFSQDKQKPADTVKNRFLPTGIRLGTDVISVVKSQRGHNFNGWEANADVDFNRYYLTADYGSWSRQEVLANGDYKNKGTYFRVGVDANFLLKDPDRNRLFIGFRYGHSAFAES